MSETISETTTAVTEYVGEVLSPTPGSARGLVMNGVYIGVGAVIAQALAPVVTELAKSAAGLAWTGIYNAGSWIGGLFTSEQPATGPATQAAPTAEDLMKQMAAIQAALAAMQAQNNQAKSA